MATLVGTSGNLTKAEELLSTTTVDANSAGVTQSLFTVPSNTTCVVTKLVMRGASTSLTTAGFSFGFNASGNDWAASGAHTGLTGAALSQTIVNTTAGATNAAAGTFKCQVGAAQGSAATVIVDCFGYML